MAVLDRADGLDPREPTTKSTAHTSIVGLELMFSSTIASRASCVFLNTTKPARTLLTRTLQHCLMVSHAVHPLTHPRLEYKHGKHQHLYHVKRHPEGMKRVETEIL